MIDQSGKTAISFEQVACDNCGSRESKFLFTGGDRLYGLPGDFHVVRCCNCGWLRQNPRPSAGDLPNYYPKDYVPYARAIEDEEKLLTRWGRHYGVTKRCRSVERFVSPGRMLEVGCGTGIFLNEMHRRGWSVVGLDPNQYASEFARKRFGLEVFSGTLEEFNPSPEAFDVICAWDVVEHLPEPAKDLRRMKQALRPGGLLVLSVPNLASLDLRLFGDSWLGWDLPRHLYFFPNNALEKFFRENAMQVIDCRGIAGSYTHFSASVSLFMKDHAANHDKATHLIDRFMQILPVKVVLAPIFWSLNILRLSTLLTFYVRRN